MGESDTNSLSALDLSLVEDEMTLASSSCPPSVSTHRSGEEVRGEEEEGPQGEVGASLRGGGAPGEGPDGGLREAVCLHTCGRQAGGAARTGAHGSGEDRWVRGAAGK